MSNMLTRRLLLDISELQRNPYPNITLHLSPKDPTLSTACLLLRVDGYGLIHTTVKFPSNYPLAPPSIEMNSRIDHPNIFGRYICASILNTEEGYTPAYTLKGIAIQMLSFFASEKVEQIDGGEARDLGEYREYNEGSVYVCRKCGCGMDEDCNSGENEELNDSSEDTTMTENGHTAPVEVCTKEKNIQKMNLPNEIMLMICDKLDTEDLMKFAQSWSRVGELITQYDMIRTRELICFCSKKDYLEAQLGVGVNITYKGRQGTLESEFDLLSDEAYQSHRIRKSVQGLPFTNWLALPISYRHWDLAKDSVNIDLDSIARSANLGNIPNFEVIYHFMNDVVVKLNRQADYISNSYSYQTDSEAKSTLTCASEKAIESYFHLFHLLLCLAVDNRSIVRSANEMMRRFINGDTSKNSCPNLGHLLVASLISDIEMSDKVIKSIIKETITRNVVWMLDKRGANMPGLSYMEPSETSHYRLQKTFEASKTSYRLLMFLNLFRKTAVGSPRKSIFKLRDEAFQRHGAPPIGTAKGLAVSIKVIHQINSFPQFLKAMGIAAPSASWFTKFLKDCIQDSIAKGYHKMPFTQAQALYFRQIEEPNVEFVDRFRAANYFDSSWVTFFPESNGRGRANRHRREREDGYQGRGRARGRGRGRGY